MATYPSSGNLPQKRAVLPGLVRRILHLLRLFWFTWLALLAVLLYGLYTGWSAPRQWSDGFFYAAVAQLISAGIVVYGGSSQPVSDAANVRYIDRGDMSGTFQNLFLDFLQKMKVGWRLMAGAALTLLISGLFLWI